MRCQDRALDAARSAQPGRRARWCSQVVPWARLHRGPSPAPRHASPGRRARCPPKPRWPHSAHGVGLTAGWRIRPAPAAPEPPLTKPSACDETSHEGRSNKVETCCVPKENPRPIDRQNPPAATADFPGIANTTGKSRAKTATTAKPIESVAPMASAVQVVCSPPPALPVCLLREPTSTALRRIRSRQAREARRQRQPYYRATASEPRRVGHA